MSLLSYILKDGVISSTQNKWKIIGGWFWLAMCFLPEDNTSFMHGGKNRNDSQNKREINKWLIVVLKKQSWLGAQGITDFSTQELKWTEGTISKYIFNQN